MSNRETFIAMMRAQGCPDTGAFQDDGTGGFHNHATEWAYIGWNRGIESQAAQIAALTAKCDKLAQQAGECDGGYQTLVREVSALTAERGVMRAALETADRTFAENGLLACHAARKEIRAALAPRASLNPPSAKETPT
jgi:hypothetical protein